MRSLFDLSAESEKKFHNVRTFKDNKTLARLLWGARELGGNSECYGCTFWPLILETFRIKN